MISKNVNINVT